VISCVLFTRKFGIAATKPRSLNSYTKVLPFEVRSVRRKRGRNGFAEYVEFVRDALSEYRCEIQEMVCEGSKVFAKVLFFGVHQKEFLGYPTTFERVEWIGAALFTVDDNKFSDVWVLGDLDALREQLSAENK
jgi:predicted ester cyclase